MSDNDKPQEGTPEPIQPRSGHLAMSPDIGALAAALAKAQASYGDLTKGHTATVGTSYSYDYASLADCLAAVLPALSANGLALLQPAAAGPGGVVITTMLVHSSGQWIASSLLMPVKDNAPQSLGSGLTYARRYSLCSLVGIAPDEDDDGSKAQGATATTVRKPLPKQADRADVAARERRIHRLKPLLAQAKSGLGLMVVEEVAGVPMLVDLGALDLLGFNQAVETGDLSIEQIDKLTNYVQDLLHARMQP